jgi:uncharacterized protein YpuA (DUF1002 family)
MVLIRFIKKNMKSTMQYTVNDSGIKTSVFVPFKKWEKLNTDFHIIQNKLMVFLSIQNGFGEIKAAKNNGKKLQSLSDFLNETIRVSKGFKNG